MSTVATDLDTDGGPPMAIPLRHFLVALGFLCLGGAGGIATLVGAPTALLPLAALHLVLAGWVCITIMGAMTQFIPVWSGVELYSRRLATLQLWLVAAGLLGFAAVLTLGELRLTPLFGALLLVGFWCFAYNIGRTLWRCDSLDITERHFGLAVGALVLVTGLGLLLAVDFTAPLFATTGVSRLAVRATHATLAGFGIVLLTVIGALYQLATMFTQTEIDGIDRHLQRFEAIGYPLGVGALAGGRLFEVAWLATGGGLLVSIALFCVAVILARRLIETKVPWMPMLSRYAVVAAALAGWAVLAVPTWLTTPLADAALFGAPRTGVLLALGVVGFVIFGTLYHIVPFIIWVDRYSDQLGYEPVPMIDDLYSDRLAAVDFGLLTTGTVAVVGGNWFGTESLLVTGGGLLMAGVVVFAANMLLVLRVHSPDPLSVTLFGRRLRPIATRTRDGKPSGDEPLDE
ncbi:hypothetical protein [Halonotius roseus]|uniref:Uncharacterized protein n=1 Tax=Halonotius roseus TaxID=2511997 RepID=A0A544QMK0_9EURY|nr:hypothetical protein [Halonotius roseus]TQQ80085.1 hypothetical protein EWF95_06210 [Halonotius roseus]